MTKRPSLLDNVPSIHERLRQELADAKAGLRTAAQRQAVLAVLIAAGAIGSAVQTGAWRLGHTVAVLAAVGVAVLARRAWKMAHAPDV